MCKRNSIFLDYFQCIPEHKRLKATFKSMQDKTENDLKHVRENKERIERQINSKGEINSQLKKEKAVNMRKERELNAKIGNVLDSGEDLESEMIKTKDKLDSLRKELQETSILGFLPAVLPLKLCNFKRGYGCIAQPPTANS